MLMLINKEALQQMARAERLGARPTSQQASDWGAQRSALVNGLPRNMSVADGVAEIRIEGVLSKKPDFWSWFFFGENTTYESIRQALALATADPTIKRVSLYVDSPGGYVDGLFDAIGALEAFEKPLSTRAAYACSAAYALASVGGKIEATNEAVQIGSIGVAVTYYHDEDVIDITSTEAPNKRPDPSTPEGKAVIVAELDEIHDLFVSAIARGRGTTVEDVNTNFGRGGVMLAAAAKKAGMIDKIAKPAVRATQVSSLPEGNREEPSAPVAEVGEIISVQLPAATPAAIAPAAASRVEQSPAASAKPAAPAGPNASAAPGGAGKRNVIMSMTKDEMKAQHPELFSAVLEDGKKAGTESERKRVLDHLELGEASGDLKIARKAIETGATVADTQASYLAAHMRRDEQGKRQQDSEAAGEALAGASRPDPKSDGGREAVANEVERLMGGPVDKA
jgi:ClpP class serine protease